jgi:glycosyltransferase involved in cell wall biosynthesis
VPEDTLRVFYRNAAAFALCSILEGFTLVTLEAMSYGVPVVATNTSSIAEGTGDAAELVPLDDPAAVAHGLAIALSPGERRNAMVRKGLERYRLFTWDRTARETLEVYEDAARGR